jgi:hypothetical protein
MYLNLELQAQARGQAKGAVLKPRGGCELLKLWWPSCRAPELFAAGATRGQEAPPSIPSKLGKEPESLRGRCCLFYRATHGLLLVRCQAHARGVMKRLHRKQELPEEVEQAGK